MNPFFSDMLIGSGVLLILLMLLWIASQWHYSNIGDGLPDYIDPPPPPNPIQPPKTTAMVHIKLNKRQEFVVSIKAANHETLQHSEGLQSKLAVKKHLAALAKATNSNGLAVKDHTGHFPEYNQ